MPGVVVLRDAYNIRISRRRPPTRDRGPSLYGSVCGVSGLEDSTTTAAHGHAHHPSVTLTPPAPRRIVACPTCEARTSPQRDTHPTRTQAHVHVACPTCEPAHMRALCEPSVPNASQVHYSLVYRFFSCRASMIDSHGLNSDPLLCVHALSMLESHARDSGLVGTL